ncbi:hypothetical protein DBR32_14665 [Taibaiella sp. KBW10]|uniref:glycosyltransferase family 2 protein n=1 Tax=Taibaiella sp. KBW10 TaxID=2153357 RepID=UPI000F59B89E|nr:glycosyltransferase family 2 protein [Taibaiella sp. KBW10]RQO29823.1 hypothetical protein DBR32_14665 [Taibaiella sp. KBW10]
MKISGFTIIRNASLYDFPIVESIRSVLPLVDEFIVVLGDSQDNTLDLLQTIDSPKIKIINTHWDIATFHKDGNIYAQQTDLALKACTGDWCIYIQADEVLHEAGYTAIQKACTDYLHDIRVEGFILKYVHFYGNYDRYIDALHFAYPKEIRIVRNLPKTHSWKDAQSFRYIEHFDGISYGQKEGTRKLNCLLIDAYMYHYGWSRDPRKIGKKIVEQKTMHDGTVAEHFKTALYDYGNLSYFPLFKGTHPGVMAERIKQMDWDTFLQYTGAPTSNMKKKFKLKYRIINFIENKLLGGRTIGGFKNYKLIGKA